MKTLLLILLLVSLLETSHAAKSHVCRPSSCGNIRNISFPFGLKHDPKHCSNPDYELACENNVTLVYLNSQKYEVKAINYSNFTVRVVDVSINNTNTCSFPNQSIYPYSFRGGYPYVMGRVYLHYDKRYAEVAVPINFMSCPNPLINSSFLTDTNDCAYRDGALNASNSSNSRHAYIKAGHMNASDVRDDMCRIDVIAMTSWEFEDLKNVSVSEIHESLLYGFELSWFWYPCSKCKRISSCYLGEDHTFTCESSYSTVIIGALLIYISHPPNRVHTLMFF
ncbi:hypothetical protein ACS0TY_000058 [Phlomoides rotata]